MYCRIECRLTCWQTVPVSRRDVWSMSGSISTLVARDGGISLLARWQETMFNHLLVFSLGSPSWRCFWHHQFIQFGFLQKRLWDKDLKTEIGLLRYNLVRRNGKKVHLLWWFELKMSPIGSHIWTVGFLVGGPASGRLWDYKVMMLEHPALRVASWSYFEFTLIAFCMWRKMWALSFLFWLSASSTHGILEWNPYKL